MPAASPGGGKADPAVFKGLRKQALETARPAFGLPQPSAPTQPWAILMETGMGDYCVTVLAVTDGTASIYLSNGGGFIGGGERFEAIRTAAKAMVEAGNQLRSHLIATTNYPLPAPGETVFYARTDAGVLTAKANEEELGAGNHGLSPLFFAGQNVITQYRLNVMDK